MASHRAPRSHHRFDVETAVHKEVLELRGSNAEDMGHCVQIFNGEVGEHSTVGKDPDEEEGDEKPETITASPKGVASVGSSAERVIRARGAGGPAARLALAHSADAAEEGEEEEEEEPQMGDAIAQWLVAQNLGHCILAFLDNHIATVAALRGLSDEFLVEAIGMKKAHIIRLRRALRVTCDGGTSPRRQEEKEGKEEQEEQGGKEAEEERIERQRRQLEEIARRSGTAPPSQVPNPLGFFGSGDGDGDDEQ